MIAALAYWLRRAEAALIGGGILVIAALTITNVFSRTLAGVSLAWAEEVCRFLIVLVTFVGLSYGAGLGRHIRMTAIYDQLPERVRKALMLVISASTSALLLALTAWSLRYVGTVRALGTVSPVLQVPLWIVYLAAPLGLGLAGVQYALTFVRNLLEEEIYLSYEVREIGADSGPGI